ncbi:hypothetical protein ACOTWR_04775 [Aliarcobacter butzleri]|jgi:hypothetical protein|uniref:hypothetical protein n=1 Tax=Aliarcobacter TaxID=2321111 RepID=UPI00112F365E|nr:MULTISPECIES: hypothetical protein [Aliarcobacter]MCT7536962.1 hypothetical protein [Aliarcobacter butzleri]MCT7623442.1 hypothetical protein [Aliarcobacter butzleri]
MEDNLLKQAISNIISQISKIEKEIESHKKKLTKNTSNELDSKLFLKGKFISFDEHNQSLEILVNGDISFYSIEDYYSQYLPFPDSTVVIFSKYKTNGNKAKIFAMKKGEIDKFATYHTLIYKGIKDSKVIFYSESNGYITIDMLENLIETYGFKIGDNIKFREIKYGLKQLFIPLINKNQIKQNRLKILEHISGE